MNYKKSIFLSVFIILIMVVTFIACAEEPAISPASSVVETTAQQEAPKIGNDTQWAWGEVTNLDNQAKTFSLKYLDYETDQEKELVLAIDDETTFENIKSLDEIKIKDTLSIDYVVGVDNKNIAKNISLEKPDIVSTVSAQTTEVAQPAVVSTESPAPEVQPIASEVQPAPVVEQNQAQ